MGKVELRMAYLVRQVAKGREYFYFRQKVGKKSRYYPLPAPTNPKFQAEYDRCMKRLVGEPSAPTSPGSFGDLVEKYLASSAFKGLTKRSQYEYRRHLDFMRAKWADLPVKRLTRIAVKAYQESWSKTPRQADAAMQVLRRLLNFAVDFGMIALNPALRPGRLAKSEGFKAWSDEALQAFRDKNVGNPTMLLALAIGLHTGQRRGDVVKMTSHDYDGRQIAVIQSKTGEKVWIPVHRDLKPILDAREKGFMLLMSERKRAFTATNLGHQFHAAVVKAGLKDLSFHGLRVTASVRLAEAGCTDAELMAILGHKTVAMAAYYRRDAAKPKMAKAAMRKLERNRP